MKQKNWIFDNCPFGILDIAFKRLFPGIEYTAIFYPSLQDDESREKVYGFTDFSDDGEITICVDSDLTINNAVEIFAHELAHVGVGAEHEHDAVWEKAFDDLFNEYNNIADELFEV